MQNRAGGPVRPSPAGSRPGDNPRARVTTPGRSVAWAATAITCRIAARQRLPVAATVTTVAPCPRRDTGGVGVDGAALAAMEAGPQRCLSASGTRRVWCWSRPTVARTCLEAGLELEAIPRSILADVLAAAAHNPTPQPPR
jgi:hypothetical protein